MSRYDVIDPGDWLWHWLRGAEQRSRGVEIDAFRSVLLTGAIDGHRELTDWSQRFLYPASVSRDTPSCLALRDCCLIWHDVLVRVFMKMPLMTMSAVLMNPINNAPGWYTLNWRFVESPSTTTLPDAIRQAARRVHAVTPLPAKHGIPWEILLIDDPVARDAAISSYVEAQP